MLPADDTAAYDTAADDTAAYATNWRVVLAADALLGVGVFVAGAVIWFLVSAAVGLVVVALGAGYGAMVGVRARRWSRLRRSGPG